MASILRWSLKTLGNGRPPEDYNIDAAGEEYKISNLALRRSTTNAIIRTVFGLLLGQGWLRCLLLVYCYISVIYTERMITTIRTFNRFQIYTAGLLPFYIVLAWTFMTPSSWPISYHYAVAGTFQLTQSWWTYINTEDEFEEARTAWLHVREEAMQYSLMAIALQHWRQSWAYLLWLVVWPIAPLLLLQLILAVIVSQVSEPTSWRAKLARTYIGYIHTPAAFALMTLITTISDIKDYIEVATVLWLPQTFQKLRMLIDHRNVIERPLYTYAPLEPGQIRRLKILKGTSTITARMDTCDIGAFTYYDAVSYHWQSAKKTHWIVVDGKRLAITDSAFQVLLACRSVIDNTYIWIDAICINQNDEKEKATQVQLMPLIYRAAMTVRYFPSSNAWDRTAAFLIHSKATAPGFDDANKTPEHIRMCLGYIDQRWLAFARIVKAEYWTRGWVAQEVTLGGKRLVYIGGCWLSPGSITSWLGKHTQAQDVNTWMLASLHGRLTAFDMCPQESLRALHQLYWHNGFSAEENINLSLEQILLLTWQCRTSDPRDRAYAMLGIAAADRLFEQHRAKLGDPRYMLWGEEIRLAYERGSDLAASYQISSERLFEKLAVKYLLGKQPTNHLLALAGTGYNSNRLKVPSWVPDLSEIRYSRPYTCLMEHEKPWCEAGTLVAPSMRPGPIPGSLDIAGVFRGTITHLNAGPFLLLDKQSFTFAELAERKREFGQGVIDLLNSVPQAWPTDHRLKEMHVVWTLTGGCGSVDDLSREAWDYVTYFDALTLWVGLQSRLAKHDLRYWMMKDVRPLPMDLSFLRKGKYIQLDRGIVEYSYGRQVAVTSEWRMCVVPPLTRIGDQIFIPAGAQAPYVVRQCRDIGRADAFELVGEANVSGLQDGQAAFDNVKRILLV